MAYTDEQISQMKEEFVTLLRSTHRTGIENVINWIENNSDFYTAPSSTNYHNACRGGLLAHSLNVYKAALKIKAMAAELALPEKNTESIPEDSIIIATLLHDLCKANFYTPTKKKWKDDSGRWRAYESYTINDKYMLGHGEKSAIMLLQLGLQLSGMETLAIRWHMGMSDPGMYISPYCKQALMDSINNIPLVMILMLSDMTASFLMEKEIDQKTVNECPLD